jgi:hypothetical protein
VGETARHAHGHGRHEHGTNMHMRMHMHMHGEAWIERACACACVCACSCPCPCPSPSPSLSLCLCLSLCPSLCLSPRGSRQAEAGGRPEAALRLIWRCRRVSKPEGEGELAKASTPRRLSLPHGAAPAARHVEEALTLALALTLFTQRGTSRTAYRGDLLPGARTASRARGGAAGSAPG